MSPFIFAWNATGHRVIAQIAYDHLTPHAKRQYSAYNRLLNTKYHAYDFVNASVWLDKVRYSTDLPGQIHYIDIPFSEEPELTLPDINSINAINALIDAESTLKIDRISSKKRALALRVMMHVLGDLHQPLHAATRVSRAYPEGDKGGNLTQLPPNPVAENLHRYWDQGAGVLGPMSTKEVRRYANLLEARWPCVQEKDLDDFKAWAEASHQIAKREVYNWGDAESFKPDYPRRAMMISESQLATAGCRLANLLNQIDTMKLKKTRAMPAIMSNG